MTRDQLTKIRDEAMKRLLKMYHDCIAEADPNDPWNHQAEVFGAVHAAACRQIDQEDIYEAEAVPLPAQLDLVEQLEDWKLHRPELADQLDPIIAAVIAVEEKGGAS